ncbi:type II toxin-antitoxin system HicB family antitoxin [Methylobacterium nodulans]|uniref:type II toxin-antitoxin system HicB family antitoxin n=1 Tax=Methylobacterium nodulans TaxID=114616 RepID=UPI003CC761C5
MVTPLSAEDGGGFAASVPDLPGCFSDGETPEEAVHTCRMRSAPGSKRQKTWDIRFPHPPRGSKSCARPVN